MDYFLLCDLSTLYKFIKRLSTCMSTIETGKWEQWIVWNPRSIRYISILDKEGSV